MPSNPYDDVLYEGHPFAQTHPDRLATIARLFGMAPAAPESCRYLELGCGDGANLIPIAYALPAGTFLGIDAGRRGIEKGAELAAQAGVRNAELRVVDILEAGPALGKFDYIVAHGVYSWVPSEVQGRLLALCSELLADHGVAYVSYNVYPGAHVRNLIGEMLQHHTRHFADPLQKIEQARAMLAFLANARTTQDAYSAMLRQEVERLAARRPASFYHDELSPHHHPVYFREFVAHAAQHGLQYLGEADFSEMQECGQTAETIAVLRQLAPDLVEREQYLDFLKCRRFRQTLLCRSNVKLDRRIRSAQMRDFFVTASRPAIDNATEPLTNHPLAEASIQALRNAWPGALSFDELRDSTAGDADVLADLILAHYAAGRFELHTRAPQVARSVSERPRAGAVARLQAAAGQFVTNLCHAPIRLEDDWSRALLRALDGSRDHADLLAELRAAAGERAGEIDETSLAASLEGFARLALLEA
jgi:methyltransferase-like protein/SAM-dependent methyltransferase